VHDYCLVAKKEISEHAKLHCAGKLKKIHGNQNKIKLVRKGFVRSN